MENIIAHGEYPVLIDAETLMHPWITDITDKYIKDDSAITKARLILKESPLSTGYLPVWTGSVNNENRNVSGLYPSHETSILCKSFQNINLDNMVQSETNSIEGQTKHIPMYDGKHISVFSFRESFLNGFKEMYLFFKEKSSLMIKPGGALSYFKNVKLRYVGRQTLLYFLLLNRSKHKKNLKDGKIWGNCFSFLKNNEKLSADSNVNKKIIESEIEIMSYFNIPRFYGYTDKSTLVLPNGNLIPDFFKQTSFEQITKRIENIDKYDIDLQLKVINNSLDNLKQSNNRICGVSDFQKVSSPLPNKNILLSDIFLLSAKKIGDILISNAIVHNSTASWIGNSPVGKSHQSNIDVLPFDLYSGTPGVCLFLSALYKKTSNQSYKNMAIMGLKPIQQQILTGNLDFFKSFGVGIGTGLSSLIYTFCSVSDFLDDICYLDFAELIFEKILSLSRFKAKHMDIMRGLAGAVLGIILLFEKTGKCKYLDAAINLCDLIEENQICDGNKAGGWVHPLHPPHIGFAHGAAGIAYALSRVYNFSQNKKLAVSIKKAIEYENSNYSDIEKNWPDFKSIISGTGKPLYPNQWCYGATGIGLSRLGCKASSKLDIDFDKDIIKAVSTIDKMDFNRLDTLCCGLGGHIDFCIEIEKYKKSLLFDNDYYKKACDISTYIINRAEKFGYFQCNGGNNDINPALFIGISGIGYQLLRVCDRDAFSSILLFQ